MLPTNLMTNYGFGGSIQLLINQLIKIISSCFIAFLTALYTLQPSDNKFERILLRILIEMSCQRFNCLLIAQYNLKNAEENLSIL